jgi:LuxR family quorum-sensing system transcriptional regulator CciR
MGKRPGLTPRERECLILTSCGLNERQIGAALGISMNTVRVHIRNLRKTLGATNKPNAVVIALLKHEIALDEIVQCHHFKRRDAVSSAHDFLFGRI